MFLIQATIQLKLYFPLFQVDSNLSVPLTKYVTYFNQILVHKLNDLSTFILFCWTKISCVFYNREYFFYRHRREPTPNTINLIVFRDRDNEKKNHVYLLFYYVIQLLLFIPTVRLFELTNL